MGFCMISSAARVNLEFRRQQLLSAQLKLLYANANLGAGVTILAATILAALEWAVISKIVIVAWALYMGIVSTLRSIVARQYWRESPESSDLGKWRARLTVGVALAGFGWGGAGIFLYPQAHIVNQVFLLFVLGGMMLGAGSLLAPRSEAFLWFLIPTGLAPAVRLLVEGDEVHFAMGVLCGVYTLATLVTTGRIYRMVESSIILQFENRELVDDLRAANQETEALNQALEERVEERTADLQKSAEQLRTEIAQREQTEEELLRARKLESLGVLAGGIAHDFNNFLTVVQGNIEVAKSQLDSGEGARRFLDQAGNACQRAASLSSQLLTFAKGGDPVKRVVSIAKLVTDAVQLAGSGSSLIIDVTIGEHLWFAYVDPSQMSQVLHNILVNAQQAMPSGGTIEVRAENIARPILEDFDPWIRISIRDYGCGISAEIMERIFDPYFTTKPGGSGLGLATAYAIVAKHGGNLSVDSTESAGTVFTIDLPASRETSQPQAPIIAQLRAGTERLLVMDDVDDLRVLFKAVLSQLGYDVQTARDGDEAIALYKAAKANGTGFDAVLLDLTVIGGMGGVETAAKLKELEPSLKLIVSSGYSDAPVMSGFIDYGFDAVILKPWTVIEISEVLRRVLTASPCSESG